MRAPSRERTAELAAGWFDAWRRYDMDWLRRNLAPDFVHTSPFGSFEGRESYLDTVEPMARKSVAEIVVLETIVSGSTAAVRFENRTPRGVVETVDWIRVEEGRIQEIRSFYDATLIREIFESASA